MNKGVILRKFWLIFCFCLMFSMQSKNAFARPEIDAPERNGPHRGQEYVRREPEDVIVGTERYRYHDGRFYRPVFFGLFEILVDIPPVGAIVTVLPVGHRTVVVSGATYYYYDNVYYTASPAGYVIVPAPVVNPNTVVVASPVTQPQKVSGETVTINVPNSNGSYTPVSLIKQKDGYLGPQGEYYPGHPTVEQLRVLYGK